MPRKAEWRSAGMLASSVKCWDTTGIYIMLLSTTSVSSTV